MNKRIKKWIRRTLLWGIGFPVALVLLSYLLLEAAWRIAPEKVDDVISGVLSHILNIDIYDEQEHDFNLITDQFDRKNYDSVHVVCDSLEGRTKVFQTDLHFYHAVAYVLQKQPKVAEFQLRKSIAAFSGDEAELTTYAHSVRVLSQLLVEKHDYAGALEVLMPAMETIKAHQKSILHLLPSSTSDLYTTMGNCLVALGRYGEAERHYHEAIASYKRNHPPVIGGKEQDYEFLNMQPNAPIGLFPGLDYEGEQIDSIKGRQLFIYTDGLNEAENQQQEQFGEDRLIDILQGTLFSSARKVIDGIRAEVEEHRNGAEPNDDLTMMCLRIS